MAPGYQDIANHYSHIGVWQILDFPYAAKLPNYHYQLVVTQQLKDSCNACALSGKVWVAYDSSENGKMFYGIKLIQLIQQREYEQ